MQFQVNNQDYFLQFVEDERQWYVFVPTLDGVERIPVYHDGPKYDRIGILEKDRHNILN